MTRALSLFASIAAIGLLTGASSVFASTETKLENVACNFVDGGASFLCVDLSVLQSGSVNMAQLPNCVTQGIAEAGICLATIDPDNIKPFTDLLPRRSQDACFSASMVPTSPVGPTPPKAVEVGYQLPPAPDGPQQPIVKPVSTYPGNEIIDPPRIIDIHASADCISI